MSAPLLPDGPRLCAQRGIILAPILFALAILFLLGTALVIGSDNFGGAITADTVAQDLRSQADLIRAKISECVTVTAARGTAGTIAAGCSGACDTTGYPDPPMASESSPIAVAALNCPGDPAAAQNIWSGSRPATFPAPPPGFGAWQYVNKGPPASGGGTCIRITPATLTPEITEGTTKALNHFGPGEYTYNATTGQVIFWLRAPLGGTAGAGCGP